jgi:hydroxymethylglutaryl-CoA reductase (NADPH)
MLKIVNKKIWQTCDFPVWERVKHIVPVYNAHPSYKIKQESILKRLLHIDSASALEFFIMGSQIAQVTGTLGIQLHIANALTAIYMAMGQDVACVAENSLGNLAAKKVDEGLRISITLPSLTIGTVGGGTKLASQYRNLKMIGCHEGENSAKKLAEIIGGATLCLEISLLSALMSNTFADAHKKYGRKNGK